MGSEEKQWRKIFEGGQTYNEYEMEKLNKLDEKIAEKRIVIDSWFDVPNRLRFLQANKFKTSKTIDAMIETTKWRSTSFPIQLDFETQKLLVQSILLRIQEPYTFAVETINIALSWW